MALDLVLSAELAVEHLSYLPVQVMGSLVESHVLVASSCHVAFK